ncbi:MAG: hypothetical protein AB1414_09480 [bacterium]
MEFGICDLEFHSHIYVKFRLINAIIRVLMWLISLILCELCASVAERLLKMG